MGTFALSYCDVPEGPACDSSSTSTSLPNQLGDMLRSIEHTLGLPRDPALCRLRRDDSFWYMKGIRQHRDRFQLLLPAESNTWRLDFRRIMHSFCQHRSCLLFSRASKALKRTMFDARMHVNSLARDEQADLKGGRRLCKQPLARLGHYPFDASLGLAYRHPGSIQG